MTAWRLEGKEQAMSSQHPIPAGSLETVLADVASERHAQDAIWGIQEFPDGTSPERAAAADAAKEALAEAHRRGQLTWRHILHEEVLEAFAESDPGRLRTELIQVAAVAVKWVQAIDRRPGSPTQPDGPHGCDTA